MFSYLLSCYVSFGVSSIRGFLAGKPECLGFTGETAPSTFNYRRDAAIRTLNESSAMHRVHSKVIGQWQRRLMEGAA